MEETLGEFHKFRADLNQEILASDHLGSARR